MNSRHRILFKRNVPVDIVPFGDLADNASNIHWPPDRATAMNVLGFEEALDFAQTICFRQDPLLEAPVISLAGLAMLKIIAWQDRYPKSDKDAQDLLYIVRNYLDAGNQDRFYNELPELLEKPDFDYEHAGAYLLGADIAKTARPETTKRIHEILLQETSNTGTYKLVSDAAKGNRSLTDNAILGLLESLQRGFAET